MPLYEDPIYGTIVLSTHSQRIINTAIFQRLKGIGQVGAAQFVFKNATHTRFEHSLGVAYLARIVGKYLSKKYTELNIGKKQLLWLELAALMHDCAHGPFSHLFDKHMEDHHHFLSHEQRSQLFAVYLMGSFYELSDIEWVVWLLDPNPELVPDPKYIFLGDIVANKLHGIDIDKLDYLVRDAKYFGCSNQVTWNNRELLCSTAVVYVPEMGRQCWVFNEKDVIIVTKISELRHNFFENFYTHPRVIKMEKMFLDLFQIISAVSGFDNIMDDIYAMYLFVNRRQDKEGINYDKAVNNFCALTDSFILFIAEQLNVTSKNIRNTIISGAHLYKYQGLARENGGSVDYSLEDTFSSYGNLIKEERKHQVGNISGIISNQTKTELIFYPWLLYSSSQLPARALPKLLFHCNADLSMMKIQPPAEEMVRFETLFHVLEEEKK